ncbi:MAG TPA: response regulator [Desulfuromonadales bacterium]|nr:response regulator [Desulfuromonadales bacterium]
MDGYKALYGILETALKQAGEESGMLLGQQLSIILSDSLTTSKSSYFGGLDAGCFVVGIESSDPYSGQFYLVFSLPDAIGMSSILLGIPPARIQEKKRLSIIEPDDIDAFSELSNIVYGAFGTVFQNGVAGKVRLKLLPPKKYVPEIDQLSSEEPLPDGDYIMFRSRLEMPGQEMNHLDVLFTEALAGLFDPQNGDAGARAPQAADSTDDKANEPEDEPVDGEETIIVLDDNEVARQQMTEMLSFTGILVAEGTLGSDMKELFTGRNVKMVMIGSQDADDHDLAVCIKVHAMRHKSPPPIIMSAESWTRTAVLKALKYGASDIIVKPCSGDDLAAKVRRYCKLPPAQETATGS